MYHSCHEVQTRLPHRPKPGQLHSQPQSSQRLLSEASSKPSSQSPARILRGGETTSRPPQLSTDCSSDFPPQVGRQPLLFFSQDVGVGGGKKGEWGGQVDRVLSIQPRYLGISLEHAVIRCNTSFHPPHDKPSPCGSWK